MEVALQLVLVDVQQVAHGDDPDQALPVEHRDVADVVLLHLLVYGVVVLAGLRGHRVAGHEALQRLGQQLRGGRGRVAGKKPQQVAFGEDARQPAPLGGQDGPDAPLGHELEGLAQRRAGLDDHGVGLYPGGDGNDFLHGGGTLPKD